LNSLLLLPEVQDYLDQHQDTDLSRFILSGSPFENISIQELAQQLEGRQKTCEKLPSWHGTAGIYFPPKINLEQTSGERAAAYKAALLTGESLADLTGGLGVDSYYFSKEIKEITYCEINASLAQIAAHNFQQLGAKNIKVYTENGIDFLKNATAHYDHIFIDPSRRTILKSKVFLLKECEPNVAEHLELLFAKADQIMVKTSPLLDIHAALEELRAVSEIHIVAVKNEVKELLFLLKNGTLASEIRLYTTNISSFETEKTTVNYQEALRAEVAYNEPLNYLYEPNAALMKSGLFNWIGNFYKLDKLHFNTQLYTSEKYVNFPGRCFKINAKIPYSKKIVSNLFKGIKANITTRNFKETVTQLRKKFKISDGGTRYLFFTTCIDGTQWVLDCSKENGQNKDKNVLKS
jgi:16S rRNA G966 N2-methylase RsmD